ncbi:MAG: alpha/beta hydrolase [Kiritimatiellae bacterium]|nr:alpha/beta hydrolase [Kiritimatiellia bacterium]
MTTLGHILSRVVWYGLLLVLLWLYLRYFEWKNLYYPARRLEATPADMTLAYEDVAFVAEDGCRLHGWWIPHERARGTVIVCHGNAGNIGDRVWLASDFHRLGLNVFLFDYRGYGLSRGLPTEQGTYRDARAAFEVVRARYADAETPPVLVYGESLGGAVAIQLAGDKPIRAVIVQSCFTSTIEMGRVLYPWLPVKWFCRWRYDSTEKVARLTMPKLFAHSREDELVPFEMGQRLYGLAAEPKEFVELSGGHNDAGWDVTPAYWKALQDFSDRVLGPERGR